MTTLFVINAIIHRDYASPATLQIRVYDDRISIWNAAHLAPDWAAEQLAEEHSSRPRNPRVASTPPEPVLDSGSTRVPPAIRVSAA